MQLELDYTEIPAHLRDFFEPVTPVNMLKEKSLCGMPWRLAFALQADGWTLRSDIVWHKLNPMPESVRDRVTRSHEYVFLFSKREHYYYDAIAIQEESIAQENRGGWHKVQALVPHVGAKNDGFGERYQPTGFRNARSVWPMASEPYEGSHFACMPSALAERCILAGTSAYGVCSACGSPWERITERRSTQAQESWSGAARQNGCMIGGRHVGRTGMWTVDTKTLGWQPTCTCSPATPLSHAIVFDPFCGSATTCLAARSHGRHGVGISNLSWAYLRDCAQTRLGDELPLFALA